MRVQFKPKIREKIELECRAGRGWAEIDHWHYPMKILEIEYFEVTDDDYRISYYRILNPLHLRGGGLAKKHTEPYHNKFQLDESLFEWGE